MSEIKAAVKNNTKKTETVEITVSVFLLYQRLQ